MDEYDRIGRMILPLKNGVGEMRLSKARAAQAEVRFGLEGEPELLAALHALVEGRGEEVSEEQRQALKKQMLLTRAGGVRGDIKAIMTAYRETVRGPILEEPLDLSNREHAAAVQWYDEQFGASLDRLRRRLQIGVAEAIAREENRGPSR